jgi:hypothetical protein
MSLKLNLKSARLKSLTSFQDSLSAWLLGINLLVCETRLGREATTVFYGENTFAFQGYHNWTPIVSWLRVIGNENRNLLRSLEISAERPDQVGQTTTGKRVQCENPYRLYGLADEIYPRHRYFERAEGLISRGAVDNLNPVIGTIFALIGKRSIGRQLTVSMQLPGYYPGQTECPGDDWCPSVQWYSMDLANLIEKCLSLHTGVLSR